MYMPSGVEKGELVDTGLELAPSEADFVFPVHP